MALTNFTEDEKYQKTFVKLLCSPELIRGVDGELIFLSALNIFLSIAAFLGNTLILVALHKVTSLHPPSKVLYRNLARTDLCVYNYTAFGYSLLDLCCEPKMGYLLLHRLCRQFGRLYFVYRFFINIDCNKRGQTTRLVAGAQIQTTCNFKKNVHNCHRFLDFVHCWCI